MRDTCLARGFEVFSIVKSCSLVVTCLLLLSPQLAVVLSTARSMDKLMVSIPREAF